MTTLRKNQDTESVVCPFCGSDESVPWASENGFTACQCCLCRFIYVNPRPSAEIVQNAVETGVHNELDNNKSAVARRVPSKVAHYKTFFREMFDDVWSYSEPISWLDIGAGYGEIIEALSCLAPKGSRIEGVEPMIPKAESAKKRGLVVHATLLEDINDKYDFVSLVHVFSHIPDFRSFLKLIKEVLNPKGEIFLETGNAADLKSRREVPTELDLPDHLTFAGKKHLLGFLEGAGFEILQIVEIRRDGIVNFCKNIIKKLIGRNVVLRIPYTSCHRAVRIRARMI
jgi:2-polyprenyl-3-methyl-5-hydroxy-6-metoxy-1,4-benzoquinol methylase